MASVVRLGVAYPQAAIGGDPGTVATFAREVAASAAQLSGDRLRAGPGVGGNPEALYDRPIRPRDVDAHLDALRTFHDAVEPLLCA